MTRRPSRPRWGFYLTAGRHLQKALAADWLARLGRRGFEALIDDSVKHSVDGTLRERVEPRLSLIENRPASIETRLDLSDRVAKLEVEMAALRKGHQVPGRCKSRSGRTSPQFRRTM